MGKRRSGIYCIRINNIPYVGKDWDIQRMKRIKSHLASLKRGDHWNKDMQSEYDKTQLFTSEILWESEDLIDNKILCELETKYILEVDSYENGFNNTLGGMGLKGLHFTEEQLKRKSENNIGSKNPMSKISLDEFLAIVGMLNSGYNNKQIGDKFGIHDRYVSLIRNKRRYVKWFEEYAPNYSVVSGKKFQVHTDLSDDTVKEIYLKSAKENIPSKVLAEQYNTSIDTINNIKNKRTFKGVTNNL